MSDEAKLSAQTDMDLDHARELVAKILEFVTCDPQRLSRFLPRTGFAPETAKAAAQSPLFMLSVIDSTIRDEELLRELQEQRQISPAILELTQARLAFQVAAEVTRPADDESEESAIRERVRLQLRALKRLLRER